MAHWMALEGTTLLVFAETGITVAAAVYRG
jgi:hypothetical protein